MKTQQRSQRVHWCVSANSDTDVLVCVGVCVGLLLHPCLKWWFMCRSSKLGQGERECVWLTFAGPRGHAGVGAGIVQTTNKQIHAHLSNFAL